MLVDLDDKREFWIKAYLAALSGLSGSAGDSDAARRAVAIADDALKAYVTKMSSF
ncbi:hypothetical protein NM213_04855 [Pseudomonas lactis]|uniref:hypothetical protein n=1 Tax=Pseudomonas lactis TaxID=1615674 RepID=UPI001F3F0996|nr:hypothetical protein [Pseudomonas lactis]MDR8369241.1 hypothetical protein [Pseudomonas lactis]